jgi:hypothetical protein
MTHAENVDDFLASLDIAIQIRPIDAMSLTSASQLTQKTNQLNMTTRRYTEVQLSERLKTPGWGAMSCGPRTALATTGSSLWRWSTRSTASARSTAFY